MASIIRRLKKRPTRDGRRISGSGRGAGGG